MKSGKINYKSLDSSCEVYVRKISLNRSESRLIANFRKDTKPSAGFIVDLDYTFAAHTLVEMDVKFPEQSFYYRARGIVEWITEGPDTARPYRLGIRIIAMEKMDPTGTPMASPPRRRKAAPGREPTPSQRYFRANREAFESPAAAPMADTAQEPSLLPNMDHALKPDVANVMTTDLKRPKAREISELLTGLIGEHITVTKAASGALDFDDIAVVGDYRGEEGRLLSLIATDLALANFLGAALAMIPKEVAQKDVEQMKISDETRENTQEIFNITTSVMNGPNFPHHRFGKLYFSLHNEQPDEIQQLMTHPADRIDYTVEVPGYGSGMMTYLLSSWHADDGANQKVQTPPPAPEMAFSGNDDGDAVDFGGAKTQYQPSGRGSPEPAASTAAGEAPPKDTGPKYTIVLPKPREIAELLTNLVGEAVVVKKAPGPMDLDEFVAVGDFVDDSDDPKGICAMDIQLANWAAAALAMIPKDVVRKDIENWKLSEESRENIQEILNISASVFNKPTMPHLRFGALYVSLDGELPPLMTAIVDNVAERVDYSVEIPGYGDGTLSCIFKAL